MLVKEKSSSGLQRVYTVTVKGVDIVSRIDKQLDAIKGRVNINGFRPGKAPKSFLKKMYGRSVLPEVLEQVSQEAVEKINKDMNVKFSQMPKADLPGGDVELEAAYAGTGDLTLELQCDLLPEITLKDLSGYEFTRLSADVPAEEIDKAIQNMADGHKHYHDKGDKNSVIGDRVLCDFKGMLDGEVFQGGEAQDATVDLGSNRYLPDFEAGIVGMKAGDVKTFDVKFPDSYGAEELAGKTTQFTITVKKVEEGKGHTIDEAFAVHMGFEDFADMRKNVSEALTNEFANAARLKLKRAILDRLSEDYAFDVPEALATQEFDAIWRNLTIEMARSGESFQDSGKTEDEARVEYQTIAARRVLLGLVLSELGSKHQVQITDREVEGALMMRARQYPGQEQMVLNYFRKNPEAIAELRAPLFEEKVIDIIISQAKITDKKVSKDELFAEEDDAEIAPKAKKAKTSKADADTSEVKPAKAKKKAAEKTE